MIAAGDASNLATKKMGSRERQSLLAMKALIERSLAGMEDGSGGGGTPPADVVGDVGGQGLGVAVAKKEAEDVEMLL